MNNEVFSMRKTIPMLSAALLLSLGLAPAADAFTLSVVPQASTVGVGGTVSVDVVASDLVGGAAPSLGAYDLNLAFDPSVLSFGSISFGTGLSVTGVESIQGSDLSAGVINPFEVSFEDTADLNSLQADAFTLFTITFNAASAGTSLLSLSVNDLASADTFTPLVADVLNGASVTVAGAPAVPLPAAGWLLISGLASTGLFARRRRTVAA